MSSPGTAAPSIAGSQHHQLRLAYIVSRFPQISETFIVRELDAIAADPRFDISLSSLFPAKPQKAVHTAAKAWIPKLRRPSKRETVRSTLWWLRRSPIRLMRCIARTILETWRAPRYLLRSLVTIPIAAAIARELQRSEVDHIHAHFATFPALAAWVCHRLAQIPYSFTAHAHDIYVNPEMLATKIDEADLVVTISKYNQALLTRLARRPGAAIEVVHCGIDPKLYPFRPREVPPSGPIQAVCVASLQEYKGQAILLQALALGSVDLAAIELDLVGDGPLRGELERLAAQLGLEGRVRFHGSLPEDAVERIVSSADLFVLPSLVAEDGQMEGLPVALMEAVASGLPVVTTELSGIPELIIDGKTGVLAQPGDAESLYRALLEVAENRATLDAEAGRQLVEAEFDAGINAGRLAEAIRACHRPR